MSEKISPIELKEMLKIIADGIYRQLISISKLDQVTNSSRSNEIREIANLSKDKIKKMLHGNSQSDNYDELYDLYIQAKYIQNKIVRRASPESLNVAYIKEWIDC